MHPLAFIIMQVDYAPISLPPGCFLPPPEGPIPLRTGMGVVRIARILRSEAPSDLALIRQILSIRSNVRSLVESAKGAWRNHAAHLAGVKNLDSSTHPFRAICKCLRNLVDLVRFELTTSSMPFKKYQSLTDILAQNKGVSARRFGLRWTPLGGFQAFGLHVDSRNGQQLANR